MYQWRSSTRFLFFFLIVSVLVSHAAFSFQKGRVLSLKVNKGVGYTGDKEVTLHIKLLRHDIKHIDQMKVGFESDLSDAEWEKFHHQKHLILDRGEAIYTIYVMVSDKADNHSPIESTRVKLDTQGPEVISMQINGGSKYSKNVLGNVSLLFDVDDANQMQIRNDIEFRESGAWIPYKTQIGWTFTKGDGEKTAYAKFRDKAGNVSEVVSSSITIDATPPTGRVQINQDETVTDTRETFLSIWASDDVRDMRITDGTQSELIKYTPGQRDAPMFHKWTFDSLDGKKIVRIFFRDLVGNISKQPATDFIIVDTKPPATPRISLNKGAQYSRNKEGKVRVFLATPDKVTTGYKMIVSNSAKMDQSKKINFSKSLVWQLDANVDGEKTVYVKIFDQTGNFSSVVSDDIVLDREAPEAKYVLLDAGQDHTSKKAVFMELMAQNATSMIVSNDPDFKGGAVWEKYTETKNSWTLIRNGKNTIYAMFRDDAGNKSKVISDEIIFDNAAPVASITINNRGRLTKDRNVILYLGHDKDAYEMLLSNNPEFAGAEWEPVNDKVNWTLTDKDGQKVVGVRFRDKAGNTSKPILGKIGLDTKVPSRCKIALNNGKEYNQQRKVRVLSQAIDAKYMLFSESSDFAGAEWQPYKSFIEIYLSLGDGPKTLYARFKDAVGNVSETVSDDVIVDSKHPVANIFLINGGAEFVNHPQKRVVLSLDATDANRMKISSDPKFRGAEWQAYQADGVEYELPGEDGDKILYIIFADVAGNVSIPLRASIVLDRKL